MRGKPGIAVLVSPEENKFLRDRGVLDMARYRTSGILKGHQFRDSKPSRIAVDCYLQGIRDAAQAIAGKP